MHKNKENGDLTFWGRLYAFLKNFLVNTLKDQTTKLLVKKILGAAAMGGVKAYILTYIVENLYDEIVAPITKGSFRKIGYSYEVINGRHILKPIQNAEDVESWRDAIRNS